MIGAAVFAVAFTLNFIVAFLVVPSFGATSITAERERQTYDTLMSTTLSARQIVWGKLLASLAQVGAIFVSTIPIVGLTFLFGGVTVRQMVASYLTLGFLPLVQGLHQVDLMNFYVGQYLAHVSGPFPGMIFAWHPWSVCRGVGMFFLIYELTSLSLARLTGERLSTPGRRWARVGAGVGFLVLDGLVKWHFTEAVRSVLGGGLD